MHEPFGSSYFFIAFFFSSRRRHTRCLSDWSSDVCSSDLVDRLRRVVIDETFGAALASAIDRQGALAVAHRAGGVGQHVLERRVGPLQQRRRDRKSVVEGKRGDVGGRRSRREEKEG